MPSLSEIDKSRCRYHLGYASPNSIPAGDIQRLEIQMRSLPDDYTVGRIRIHLDRCDRAFDATETGSGTFSQKQLVTGDINRTTVTSNNKDYRILWDNYQTECDRLAFALNVASYSDPRMAKEWFVRYGDVSVFSLGIGVADTCTGDRMALSSNYA